MSIVYNTVFRAGLAGRPLMIFLEENKTFLMIKNSGQIGQDAYRENGQLAMGGGPIAKGGQTGQIVRGANGANICTGGARGARLGRHKCTPAPSP